MTFPTGSIVRERATRWSPVRGVVQGPGPDGVVVDWYLPGYWVALGVHDPANLEAAP